MGNAFYDKGNDLVSKILLRSKSPDLFFLHGKFLVQSYNFPHLSFPSSTIIDKGFPLITTRQHLGLVHKENAMIYSFLDKVLICIHSFDLQFPSGLSFKSKDGPHLPSEHKCALSNIFYFRLFLQHM